MAKQPRILAGETAAITGAARGIGRATAEAFLRHGMRVAIGDVDFGAAQATAEDLGPSAVAIPLDVTDRASFTAFLDSAEEQLGPLDVLVNNAGIMQVGRFIDEDDLTAKRMVDINLHGVILGTKIALDRMIPRDRGHIVNIASQAGKFGAPGGATYSATKFGVIGMTEAVRGELRLMGAHIDVSYVMPYVVNTELGSGLGETRGMSNLEPSEVADAVVEALQLKIVDVYVPKSARRTVTLSALLPRSFSEGLTRAMKADRVLAGADLSTRREYELRASRSEPGLQAAPAQAQIPSPVEPPEPVAAGGAEAAEAGQDTPDGA
jgi:NADP-dependent 3-hydroxy acid dehydrogenase YdfG